MISLRPYQVQVIDELATSVSQRALLVAPTGSGKTVIAAELTRRALARGQRVLFLVHRRELTAQTWRKLHELGIDAGVIQAGVTARLHQPAQVAMIPTLHARAYRGRVLEKPEADLVVVDEAHHVRARTYEQILADYPKARVVGLTATPCRGDGRGLGAAFDTLIECPQVHELIEDGYLVSTRVYAPETPDLAGVTVRQGDYAIGELEARMDKAQLIGDIVTHWHRLAEGRPTVVFATGVQHSLHIRDEFCRSGILAEHIDGTTPSDVRDRILERLAAREIDLVTNAMVLTEGWDCPAVSCLVLARPTKSLGLFRQMVGRVLRPAPGKSEALVIDHSGAIWQHGLPEDPIEWTLEEDKRARNEAHEKRKQKGTKQQLSECPECSAIRMQGQPCPACGWRPQREQKQVRVVDGDLAHITPDRRPQKRVYGSEEQREFHRQLLFIALERGYKPGWAGHKYKERFGEWPPWGSPEPVSPSPETRSWVRSQNIAYAKSRAS